MKLGPRDWRGPGLALGLVLVTWAVFFQVRGFEFVNYDDNGYVYGNLHTLAGLSWRNLGWAMTTGSFANWHPLTWLSHMADITLFGAHAGPHHLTSLAFHTANVLLLFALLCTLTREVWPSALVAALFAIHPLHVESVAWISERKDVLSLFFGLLSLWAYAADALKPAPRLKAAAFLALGLGLMAKPMLVSLPLLMLCLDFWPLGRMPDRAAFLGLVRGKVPYFLLSLGSCLATLAAQNQGGAIISMGALPFAHRVGNALTAYAWYLGKTFWPFHLAALHLLKKEDILLWEVLACAALLAAVTVLAFRLRRTRPYLLAGWLWYLVSLVPVIGLVQVGFQSVAERYTYLPLTGVLVMLVWGARDLAARFRVPVWARAAAVVLVLAPLMARAHTQASYWRTSITLWTHDLRVAPDNSMARENLAEALYRHGRNAEAIEAYRAAMRSGPESRVAVYGLALALRDGGRPEEALEMFRKALANLPGDYVSVKNIATLLVQGDRLEEAIPYLEQYLKMEPERRRDDPDPVRELAFSQEARMRLGMIQRKLGRDPEAVPWFAQAFRADPADLNCGYNLALSLASAGREAEAAEVLGRCALLKPSEPLVHFQLGLVLVRLGKRAEAAAEFRKTLALQPRNAEAGRQLAKVSP